MKICDNCGAHLDAGERCDCQRETLADVLKMDSTDQAARMLQSMPMDIRMFMAGRIMGFAEAYEVMQARRAG